MKLQEDLDILTILRKIKDPRMERTRKHLLVDILFIGFCATLCGCNSWVDVVRFAKAKIAWFRRFIELLGGVPSHDTFSRVFGLLKASQMEACFKELLVALHQRANGNRIAIDGKTLSNSSDGATGKASLHLLCAWSVDARVVLGQEATDAKSNEITAIPKLLERLELTGAIVTIDAMGCQKEIAEKIIDEGGDYILALKKNHPTLYAAVEKAFIEAADNDYADRGVRRYICQDKSPSRPDIREHYLMPAPEDLPGKEEWKGLKSIGMVVRRRTVNGKETAEIRYFLSSRDVKVREFASAVRSHWSIENTLHWSLDVTFTEDNSRIRKQNGPEVSAWLRRMVLSILKQDTSIKASLRGKRLILGWDEPALERFLSGISGV